MSEIKYIIKKNKKYNSKSVYILYANFELDEKCKIEECKIEEINETEFNYKNALISLSDEKVDEFVEVEYELNNFLKKNGIDEVTIVYGNKLYVKIKKDLSSENLRKIKLRGVFINEDDKPYPQLWLRK